MALRLHGPTGDFTLVDPVSIAPPGVKNSELLAVITANFLPDFVAIFGHVLIVTRFARHNTGLVIRHSHAFLGGKLFVLLLLAQHVQHALAGLDFSGEPSAVLIQAL